MNCLLVHSGTVDTAFTLIHPCKKVFSQGPDKHLTGMAQGEDMAYLAV
jgi:hypothetical protein